MKPAHVPQKKLPIPVVLFIIARFLPWIFSIGSLAIMAYRVVLLIVILPCLFMWMRGKAGPIRIADILLFLFWLWCAISFAVVDGLSNTVQPIGILFVETIGPYLLARIYIRSAEDFYNVVKLLFRIVVILLPFAAFESITERNILYQVFSSILPAHGDASNDPRWGLRRVATVFEHPILFGVVTGSILALVHLVLGYQRSFGKRIVKTMAVAATAFFSLSAGPISAMAAQTLLLAWNGVLSQVKARWKILWGLVALMYVFIATVSNQSVPAFYLTYFSFDTFSAYFRILIWNYGTQSVMNHPLFGTTYGEWDRPDWMPPSIDMFWLIHAVQHGLPAGILMMLFFGFVYVTVSLKKGLDDRLEAYRTAYLITMTGFFLVGWTVHFWNATYVLFLFLLGSGVWLLDVPVEQKDSIRRQAPRPVDLASHRGQQGAPKRARSVTSPEET
jgi:hypothetical protein